MLVNGTHVRRLDLDGKAAAEPPFAAEMRDHTFLQPHTTPQNVGGPHLFEGQSASGATLRAAGSEDAGDPHRRTRGRARR